MDEELKFVFVRCDYNICKYWQDASCIRKFMDVDHNGVCRTFKPGPQKLP